MVGWQLGHEERGNKATKRAATRPHDKEKEGKVNGVSGKDNINRTEDSINCEFSALRKWLQTAFVGRCYGGKTAGWSCGIFFL